MIYLTVAHIKEFVVNDIFKIVCEIVPVVHNSDGIQSDILIVDLEIVFQFTLGSHRIPLYGSYCIGFFQIADMLCDRCNGAGESPTSIIYFSTDLAERVLPFERNHKVCQPLEDLGFSDLIAVNGIVQNDGFIKLIQIDPLSALAVEFDSLWEATPDKIIGEGDLFSKLFPVFGKFFIDKWPDSERNLSFRKLFREFPG